MGETRAEGKDGLKKKKQTHKRLGKQKTFNVVNKALVYKHFEYRTQNRIRNTLPLLSALSRTYLFATKLVKGKFLTPVCHS